MASLRSKNAEVAVKLRWSRKNFPFALIFDIHSLCLVFWDKQLLLCLASSCLINFVSPVLHRNFLIPNVFLILPPSNLWLPTFKLGSQASHPLLEQILCNPKKSNQSQSTRVSVAFANVQLYTPNFRSKILAPSHPLSTTTIFFFIRVIYFQVTILVNNRIDRIIFMAITTKSYSK